MHCSKRSFLRFWHLPKIADSSPTSLTTALSKSRGASTPFCCKTPKQVLSEQHLTMWCKWSVQMQHLQVSGFHPLWGETPFLLWVPCRQAVFFIQDPYWPALGDRKAAVFCGFNGHFGHLCCWRVWSKHIRRFKKHVSKCSMYIWIYIYIYQPGSWLELIFNPQSSSHNGFFELINPGKLTCHLKRDYFNSIGNTSSKHWCSRTC